MHKILVVDDEKDVLQLLEKRLTSEGYAVITASSGFDAISLAKLKLPDLILLDILMPGVDGGEVARKLKGDPNTQNIPVIFLTALLSKKEERQVHSVIANNITFAKPIDTEKLLTQIKKLL